MSDITFKALSALDMIDLQDASALAAEAVTARYPDLKGLEGDAYKQHPKRPRYLFEIELYATFVPCVQAAWTGKVAPTAEFLSQLPYATLLDYCRRVRAANPFLEELPAPVEAADPNA